VSNKSGEDHGLLTIIAVIPSLAYTLYFTIRYKAPITNILVVEKMVIVICCSIGGIPLWQGKRWGFVLSAIGWLIILCTSIYGIYNIATRSDFLLQNAIFVAIGIPALVILIREIFGRKKV
jgi:hypothetical protein